MLKRMVLCLLFCSLATLSCAKTKWHTLKPGLDYARLVVQQDGRTGYVHAFKIDLKHYQLKLELATRLQINRPGLRRLTLLHNALLAVNGGFYTPDQKPLGLRISSGKAISSFKKVSWWSVFAVKNNKAYIESSRAYRPSKAISFAIQAGPRLIVNGRVSKLKPGRDERTALGIDTSGNVLVVVTDHLFLATTRLAQMMRRSSRQNGLGCVNALNLDGGSSTQVYARVGEFVLDRYSLAPPVDAVLVVPKGS